MSMNAIMARSDWPDIQMRHANGQSISSLAAEIGVHKMEMSRALRNKITVKERKLQVRTQEIFEELQAPLIAPENIIAPTTPGEIHSFSVEALLTQMHEDQAALRAMAEEHQSESPMISITARKASLDASAQILKAATQYQIHSEKDITKHPEFNKFLSKLMTCLNQHPDALESVALMLEGHVVGA
jgi:hypothetical protein